MGFLDHPALPSNLKDIGGKIAIDKVLGFLLYPFDKTNIKRMKSDMLLDTFLYLLFENANRSTRQKQNKNKTKQNISAPLGTFLKQRENFKSKL